MTFGNSVTLCDLGCLIGNGAARFGERLYSRVHSGVGEGRVRVPKQETFYKSGRSVNQKEITMSAQEIQALAQQFAEAFNNKNIKAALDMLSDDLEVFDHVPYRFDNKAQFANFLAGAVEGVASMSFGFRQPSCRVFNDTTGIVNAFDTFTGVTKDGKAVTIHRRTTLVFVKQGGQWKIVSGHFSPLPHAS